MPHDAWRVDKAQMHVCMCGVCIAALLLLFFLMWKLSQGFTYKLVSFHLGGQCVTKTQATSTHHLGFLYGIGPPVTSLVTITTNGPH
jgi:hypothetical protein